MCRASRAVHTNCQTINDRQVKERRILSERTMGRGVGSVAGGAAELTEDGHPFNPDILCARYQLLEFVLERRPLKSQARCRPPWAGENSPGLAQHFDNMLAFPILKSALRTGTLPGNFVP
jgi:hypothetical protein